MWLPTKCTDTFGSLSVFTNHAAQRVAPAFLAADAHLGREQGDHHVHVARVERQRIAHRELLDLGQ